jgi:SAM-dependent methyltransferase
MTLDEAIEHLRADPEMADLVRDSYLGGDTIEASERFERTGEFAETIKVVGGFEGRDVVDVGAGTGIVSRAIANAGARRVYALDPDPSPLVGRGAIERLGDDRIEILDGVGEDVPLPDESVDVVYGRQVLHHTQDLDAVAHEAMRVLRPGGIYFFCREHVVANEKELEIFLRGHAVHRLAGGENAYSLEEYTGAIERSGLETVHVWGVNDSIINAWPGANNDEEMAAIRRNILGPVLYRMGPLAQKLPVARTLSHWRFQRHNYPGAAHTFVARRPPESPGS